MPADGDERRALRVAHVDAVDGRARVDLHRLIADAVERRADARAIGPLAHCREHGADGLDLDAASAPVADEVLVVVKRVRGVGGEVHERGELATRLPRQRLREIAAAEELALEQELAK